MMHIVFVTPELNNNNGPQGGLGTFVANTARIFNYYGHKVEILLVTSKQESSEFDDGIVIHNLYIKKWLWDDIDNITRIDSPDINQARLLRIEILNSIKSEMVRKKIFEIDSVDKIDVIHFSNHGSFSRFLDNNIPYVIRVSGLINLLNGGGNKPGGSLKYSDNPLSIRDENELKELKKCKNVIAPSNLLATILQDEANLSITVLESPFLLEENNWDFSIYNKKLKNRKYILFYGTCSYLKGIHVVADLIEEFLRCNIEYEFVICGRDTEIYDNDSKPIMASEFVKKSAGVYGDRVIYLGLLLREQLYPIINNAEMCVMPSRIENLSNACIEAMSMGKIVVATNGASFEQLIINGYNGYLCERDNAADFLKMINSVIKLGDEEKERIGKEAKKTTERLSPSNIYKQYLNYYMSVIENNGKNVE